LAAGRRILRKYVTAKQITILSVINSVIFFLLPTAKETYGIIKKMQSNLVSSNPIQCKANGNSSWDKDYQSIDCFCGMAQKKKTGNRLLVVCWAVLGQLLGCRMIDG